MIITANTFAALFMVFRRKLFFFPSILSLYLFVTAFSENLLISPRMCVYIRYVYYLLFFFLKIFAIYSLFIFFVSYYRLFAFIRIYFLLSSLHLLFIVVIFILFCWIPFTFVCLHFYFTLTVDGSSFEMSL